MDEPNHEQWTRIRGVLDQALEAPAEARPALLDTLCRGDAGLRTEIELLIEAESSAGALLEEPVGAYAGDLIAELAAEGRQVDDAAGRRVGAYRLVREVARGGMGTVYQAERADGQFTQRVAVKLLRRGLDTDDLLRRFLAERQILASLNHPHIARLLDGGATDDGRPYLVMEYVEGQPIDAYCDARRLSVEERLRLFLTVAEAVQHAHRKLVVHRDLKPANILVTETGEVKLLDFGIAKLLQQDEGASTLPLTRTGVRLMTPEYASPEQVRGEPITTASDVYQLGLLLYELLAGRRAYRLAGCTAAEAELIVCTQEPARPSTASTRTDPADDDGPDGRRPTPTEIAAARRTTPERLRGRLRGDLDTITLQALDKEPERRYASAEALAEDVRRHLARLPVRARGDTRLYRARRFVRRHRWGVAAAAILLVLLSGYAVTVSVQAARIQAALETARLETAKAELVGDFLIGLFQASRPEYARGEEVTARELLAHGVEQAEQLADQPEVQAQMLAVIGKTFHRLGLFDEAQQLYQQALDLRERHFGGPHEQIAESLNDLGVLLKDRGDYAGAEPLLRRGLAMRRQVLGDEHEEVAVSLDELGRLLQAQGDYAGAEPLFREGLAMRRRLLGNVHHETASSVNSVALILRNLGRDDEAELLLREALAIYRELFGDDHPWTATVKGNLALVLIDREDWAPAEALLREALEVERRSLGEDHVVVAHRLNQLGTVYRDQGRLEEADALLGQALRVARPGLGNAHPLLAAYLVDHGRLHLVRGDPEAAEPVLREALEIRRGVLPEGDWRIAEAEGWLGEALANLGRPDEAESLLVASHAVLEGRWGPDDGRAVRARERLLRLEAARGRPGATEL